VPTVVAEKAAGSVTHTANMSSRSVALSVPLIDVKAPGPAAVMDCAVPGREPASPTSVHEVAVTADTHTSTIKTANPSLRHCRIAFSSSYEKSE
jgi:hypothetical protein